MYTLFYYYLFSRDFNYEIQSVYILWCRCQFETVSVSIDANLFTPVLVFFKAYRMYELRPKHASTNLLFSFQLRIIRFLLSKVVIDMIKICAI